MITLRIEAKGDDHNDYYELSIVEDGKTWVTTTCDTHLLAVGSAIKQLADDWPCFALERFMHIEKV